MKVGVSLTTNYPDVIVGIVVLIGSWEGPSRD